MAEVIMKDPGEVGLSTAIGRAVVVGQVEMGNAQIKGSTDDGALGVERSAVTKILPKPERYGR
jgi:hypothetical protein